MHENPSSLVYIKISNNCDFTIGMPFFDPNIPIPLLLHEGQKSYHPKDISQEMILAGMLRLFAYERENQHLAYYRNIFLALRPDIRAEMTNAAILKIKNGNLALAEELFLALEYLFPDDMRTKLNLALLMDERSRFYEQAETADYAAYYADKALEAYNTILTTEPPMPEAFFNAAFFFMNQKKYKKAKSLFESYIHIETSDTDSALGRKEKAAQYIDRITSQALDEDLFLTAFNFAHTGMEERALETIKTFLEHHPTVWHGWFLLGWILRRLKRWQDGCSAFLHCLELGKSNQDEFAAAYCDICNELAICLMEMKAFADSKKWLLAALTTEPENLKILSNLGTLALKQGNYKEAQSYFTIVLDIHPADPLALQILRNKEPVD